MPYRQRDVASLEVETREAPGDLASERPVRPNRLLDGVTYAEVTATAVSQAGIPSRVKACGGGVRRGSRPGVRSTGMSRFLCERRLVPESRVSQRCPEHFRLCASKRK